MTLLPLPPPGRLMSLGEEVDLADAADLLAVFRACANLAKRPGRGPRANRVARIALAQIWDVPRERQHPRFNNKPTDFPWSPRAVVAFLQGNASESNIVLEHLVPLNLLWPDLFARIDKLDARGLIDWLNQHHVFAIIHREDDAVLEDRYRTTSPNIHNPWSRYEAMRDEYPGLDPRRFRSPALL